MIWNRVENPRGAILFAHGAGAPMDSPFMNEMAEALARLAHCSVARFEFPYMVERRETGKRRPPNPQPVLLDTWREAVTQIEEGPLVLAGKSMGGRMATLIADEVSPAGVLCFGYPFHPPRKPDRLRTEHLGGLRTPLLICQGERDPMGTREEVVAYDLSPAIQFHWAPDGDHDLKPRKKSGHTHDENLADAVASASAFLETILSS